MKLYLLLSSLILAGTIASGQTELDLHKAKDHGFEMYVQVEEGQTLYSLAKATGQSIDLIVEMNNKESLNLHVGETILLEVDFGMISLKQPTSVHTSALYYTVQAGDNLFRIATRAHLTVDDLLRLNKKPTTDISLNERLLMGWIQWSTQSLSLQRQPIIEMSPIDNNFNIEALSTLNMLPEVPDLDIKNDLRTVTVKEKGIAYWDKKEGINRELVVMHPHARVNSEISLYNPMLKRKVNALVVGEFPRQSYANDISVVISPSVANALGALDKRFLVEITYTE